MQQMSGKPSQSCWGSDVGTVGSLSMCNVVNKYVVWSLNMARNHHPNDVNSGHPLV